MFRRRRLAILTLTAAAATAASAVLAQTAAPAQPAAPGAVATSKPSTIPADQSTPRGAFKTLLQAQDTGDGKALKATISTTNPTEEKIVDAMAKSAEANNHLRKAAEKAFGPEAVGARTPGSPAAANWDRAMAQIDGAHEVINGENATVDLAPNQAPPLPMKKVNGKWTIPLSQVAPPIEPSQLEQNLSDLDEQVRLVNEVAKETEAGKYKTLAEMNQALQEKVAKAMMAKAQASTKPATSGPAGTPPTAPGPEPRTAAPAGK